MDFLEQLGEKLGFGCLRIGGSIRRVASQRLVLFPKYPGKAQGTCIRHAQIYISSGGITSTCHGNLIAIRTLRRWGLVMLAGAIVAILLIFGLFLSMLSSSPKAESECHPDTGGEQTAT